MTDILLIVALALLVTVVTVLLMLLRKSSQADASAVAPRLDAFVGKKGMPFTFAVSFKLANNGTDDTGSNQAN